LAAISLYLAFKVAAFFFSSSVNFALPLEADFFLGDADFLFFLAHSAYLVLYAFLAVAA